MRKIIRTLKFGLTQAAGYGGFFFWRGLERGLGIRCLFLVAWFCCGCRATFNEISKRPKPARNEPAWLRIDGSLRARVRRRQQGYLIHILGCFADRMGRPEWRALCRLEGAEHLEAARRAGRPVVLGFFHYGLIYNALIWLRAYGYPVAIYRGGDLKTRGKMAQIRDRLMPFPEVRALFFPGEMREVLQFMRSGHMLLLAVDMPTGRRTTAETDDGWMTRLNTGAAELANLMGADLMVLSSVYEEWNRFRIRIIPVGPGGPMRTEKEWAEANRRLFAGALPDFKKYPGQFTIPLVWEQTGQGREAAKEAQEEKSALAKK